MTQDAAFLLWDNIRERADLMRYYTDCCGKSWHDAQLQQIEHNRIVWFPPTRIPTKEIPCLQFAEGDCGHKQDHPDGPVIRIHAAMLAFM